MVESPLAAVLHPLSVNGQNHFLPSLIEQREIVMVQLNDELIR